MTKCVYCDTEDGTTRDHVPPKLLFPKPRPQDTVTVPACESCNGNAAKDEEYFLACYMLSDAGVTPAGQELWEQKLRRALNKNTGLRAVIARSLKRMRVRTPSGLDLGQQTVIKLDHDRLDRVVLKIVRGLYYHEFGEPIGADTNVECLFLATQSEVNRVEHFAAATRPGRSNWDGVFEYRSNRIPDEPEGSIWFLRFYGKVVYWAISSTQQRWDAVRRARGRAT